MMRTLKSCIILYFTLTIITGIAYPAVVTGILQLIFPNKANGDLILTGTETKGSESIGQKFTDPSYFWSRPSTTDYSPLPSGASNLGPTSESLKQTIQNRQNNLTPYISLPIPGDLLLASGSGLDPHISPNAALAQIDHVAQARNLSNEQKTKLTELVQSEIEKPQWGIFGAPRVNVLRLNMLVDKTFGVPEINGAEH